MAAENGKVSNGHFQSDEEGQRKQWRRQRALCRWVFSAEGTRGVMAWSFLPFQQGSFPSRYLFSRKVHTWRRSEKGKGQWEVQILPLNTPIPPMPAVSSHGKHIQCATKNTYINHRSYWTHTDGTGWFFSTVSQSAYFLKVSKNLWFPPMPEQQLSRLFSVHPRNLEKSILASSWVILIFL